MHADTETSPRPQDALLPQLTRRGFLRAGAVVAGGVGVTAVVSACAAAVVPAWTVAPSPAGLVAGNSAPPPASAAAAASPALPSPSAVPAAASTGLSSTGPSAAPSTTTAKAPSPSGFAVPPPYRPKQAAPFNFALASYDGPAQRILIAPDRVYASMNFNGQVPAPTLRVTEGDTVRFTLTNQGKLSHSIDFHAAQTPWSKNYGPVAPGASFSFEWTAHHAGVFMYHCGAAPVIMHIGDGMYGAVIVDPSAGRATAREYVLVQGEFYGQGSDYAAMLNNPPDVVAFNGQAFRYKTQPLTAVAGELVRLFIVNAGPNLTSAFHVIGALFDHYEASGSPDNAQGMHQTVGIPPGDGALVELRFPEPGTYPFVTHKFNDAEKGATGLFVVTA